MNVLLIRVGADQSTGGGSWNGPVDCATNAFAYVAIPEHNEVHSGFAKPYATLAPTLATFNTILPVHLRNGHMHLDPDFEHLTYGDSGRKALQLQRTLRADDYVVFYAGLRDIRGSAGLVYAIIGYFEVDDIVRAVGIPIADRDTNAHARRVLSLDAADVVVRGRSGRSGRLTHCVPIGEYRDRAYRVRSDLLREWGGLTVADGYLQRSARVPGLVEPPRFLIWLERRSPTLIQSNN